MNYDMYLSYKELRELYQKSDKDLNVGSERIIMEGDFAKHTSKDLPLQRYLTLPNSGRCAISIVTYEPCKDHGVSQGYSNRSSSMIVFVIMATA